MASLVIDGEYRPNSRALKTFDLQTDSNISRSVIVTVGLDYFECQIVRSEFQHTPIRKTRA